jgi:GNAT superfamily N-acetyltransferase
MTSAIIPIPRSPVTTRLATPADQPFIDGLQKLHTHMVGWMPAKQIEGKIAAGQVVVAQDERGTPVGYCISHDQYSGRDDVGVIYQLNVLPLRQRNLIGATLIKAVFERAAYGCRLFCLWCAQDIQANWFWESVGFVPLAFRTGSASKQRIHIFWQRRVREGDGTTPYWFPSQTKNGAIREDRLVLPIPPGTHWRDVMPVVLPGMGPRSEVRDQRSEGAGLTSDLRPLTSGLLPGGAPVRPRPEQPKYSAAQKAVIQRSQSAHLKGVPLGKKAVITAGGIKYVDRTDYVPEIDAPDGMAPPEAKPKRAPKPRQKNDPKLVAAARDLRDRYLEHYNAERLLPSAQGKYDVSRALAAPAVSANNPILMPEPPCRPAPALPAPAAA